MDYQQSGVNIDAGNKAVDLIKPSVKRTFNANVLSNIGNFAAGFKLDKEAYDEPILVSCTDGVGTKLKIAIDCGKFDTIGIDLVAMCVNDLICMGAKPLFFLDYYACHALNPDEVKLVIDGISEGCVQSDCALIGGEMAEMNDMYKKGDFDLAGFCVGVVDRKKVIDGSSIAPGHHIYALPSSGIHSNGYSLVRKVLTTEVCQDHNINYESLLEPTKIYVKEIHHLLQQHTLSGIAHITGGGLAENIERILPKNCHLELLKAQLPKKDIFKQIQEIGKIEEKEMYRVFNMGVGMVVFSPEKIDDTQELTYLGEVTSGHGDVALV